jgi:hypothetical protein
METELNGVIGAVYEDPATHWIMLRIDDCECHGASVVLPHVLRIRELPVDEKWLADRRGKRICVQTSVLVEQ